MVESESGRERQPTFARVAVAITVMAVASIGWPGAAASAPNSAERVSPGSPFGSVVAYPQLAVDHRGDVTAVWQQSLGSGPTVIEASQRSAGGRHWTSAQQISSSGQLQDGQPADGGFPAIAESARGAAVVVWEDNGEIAAAQRTQAFGAWSRPTRISPPAVDPEPPRVVLISAESALAIWTGQMASGNSVVQIASLDLATGRWTTPTTIETSRVLLTGAGLAASTTGRVVAVWKRAIGGSVLGSGVGRSEVLAAVGSSSSRLWHRITRLGQETDLSAQIDASTEASQPQVGVGRNGAAVVVWQAGAATDVRIAVATLGARSREWRRERPLGGSGALYPVLGVGVTATTVAWQSSTGAIWTCSRPTVETAWLPVRRMTSGSSSASGPVIATGADGATVVAWTQKDGTVRAVGHAAGSTNTWPPVTTVARGGAAMPAVVVSEDRSADVVWVHSARPVGPHGSLASMAIEQGTVAVPVCLGR